MQKINSSEITDERVYHDRRQFIQKLTIASVLPTSLISSSYAANNDGGYNLGDVKSLKSVKSQYSTTEKLTTYHDITSYNNFYEFGTDKSDPGNASKTLHTIPWTIKVEGLVNKPKTYGLDDLLKLSPIEERIYRLRCVEGWSMIIPWLGYSLSNLIKQVNPQGSAKYIEFVTLADQKQMPGIRSTVLHWPYTEGLRLDEAMHPLTLLTFGLYGNTLPQQNGAPLRVIVPWKYGFKSPKSIIAIRFTDKMPATAWNQYASNEYGFYSNVNPNVDHPRWSQATERRIGEGGFFTPKKKTLLFNGYTEVASLYTGMDLKKNF